MSDPSSPPPSQGEPLQPTVDGNAAWEGRTTTVGPPRERDRSFEGTDLLRRIVDPGQRPGSIGRIDHYEVLSEIGHGAMGIVVRSFDTALERIVAMKLMAPSLLPSETAKQRFFREAKVAAGISHPNVVTIHAVGQFKNVPYLVMEYVDGKPLSDRIREGTIPVVDVIRISRQIAEGLAAAHRHGLIHRDIKPANILLEDSIERVRIADFGLARVALESSDLTSQGDIVGTPSYMSPEQVEGEPLDPRTDLFSAGCVMYAMLTGASPFQAANALAATRRIATAEPRPLADCRPETPRPLRELVHALLRKRREDRIPSAADLATALRRLQVDWESNLNLPTVSVSRPPRPWGRWAALGLVPVLLLAALYGARTKLWPPAPSEGTAVSRPAGTSPPWVNSPSGADLPVPAAVDPPQAGAGGAVRGVVGGGEKRARLWVSSDGKAPFVRIADALAAAKPGETIEVDGGTYREAIALGDPIRHAGIRIRGPGAGAAAVLSSETGEAVIRVDGVPDVEIAGLTINAQAGQRAVLVAGSCPGLTVSRCRLQAIHENAYAGSLLHLIPGTTGTEDRPIRVDEVTFRFAAVGLVCGDANGPGPVRFVRVTRCRFTGPRKGVGLPVILLGEVENVFVAGNRMDWGQSPLSLSFATPRRANEVRFEFNSIAGFEVPLSVNDSPPNQGIRYDRNLLVDVDGVPQERMRIEEIAMWFAGNVWEHPADEQKEKIGLLAERVDLVPLQSRDGGAPAFLVPGSDELKAGHSRFAP
ncbi:serine/threonine-protein kinase [Planctomyces sp. SH-PL14]|uniref:serine/threonine-protein kinase n=1 Tax=Planctomyces sp. SH-PL14 TaxID=1632864 RepID=UPI00078C6812|nr:serine/threonine-protein kinase [Planctomyces sp. SH-PL14]AMV20825.1 Serine/threonine-protein kinase PrkC [Planctomyces sp. SH-PL14]